MRLRRLAIAAVLLLAAAPLAAQSIRGRVLDAASGAPVPQAEVTLRDAAGRVVERERAGDDGTFSLAVRATGAFRLRAERVGYAPSVAPVDASVREVTEVEIRLAADAAVLEPLVVTARRPTDVTRALDAAGFFEREAAQSGGRFLRREDLTRGRPHEVSEVLRRVPGVRRVRVGNHGLTQIVMGRSELTSLHRPLCLPALFLDGAPIALTDRESIDSVIDPDDLEAIEVYTGPSGLPPAYAGAQAACGVIVMWSRRASGDDERAR